MKILVVVPCYNEEEKIGTVVRRVLAAEPGVMDELLVVDDGSTDKSATVAREKGAQVLSMGRCVGVGAAIRSGVEHGLGEGFDICVVMAGNNKDEPNEIIRLVKPIADEGYDFVQGSRYLPGGRGGNMPGYRKVATRVHPFLFSLLAGRKITESTNGFRAFRLGILEDKRINLSQKWLDEYELEPYLLYMVLKLGCRHTEVPCTKMYPPRSLGQTKMTPILGWWSILRPVILLSLGLRR